MALLTRGEAIFVGPVAGHRPASGSQQKMPRLGRLPAPHRQSVCRDNLASDWGRGGAQVMRGVADGTICGSYCGILILFEFILFDLIDWLVDLLID